MRDFSIDTKWLAMVLEGAQSRGLNCTPMMLKHGISGLSVKQKGSRVPLDSFAAFSVQSMQALNDEYLGLGEKAQPLGSFSMMTQAAISARTLDRSLRRTAKFWNLFENSYIHDVEIEGGSCIYSLTRRDSFEPLNDYLVSAILSSVHRFHCWIGGQFLSLEQVELDHPRPDLYKEYSPLYYGAPISFDHGYASIKFPARYLNTAISQTAETLDEYLKRTNLSLLYQPKNYRVISDQVRQWLERNIKQGNYRATLREASEHFQLSQQVMHRRLMAENLSFKEIKMQTRRDIAIKLLFEGSYKIEEIAILVGFSEPSAFIRAFKSWTGQTPRNYRQSQKPT